MLKIWANQLSGEAERHRSKTLFDGYMSIVEIALYKHNDTLNN
jgi:hypothetical protein